MSSLFEKLEQYVSKANEILHIFLRRAEENSNRRTVWTIAISVGIVFFLYLFFISPPNGFPYGRLVDVPEDASLSEIAQTLKEAHVVRSATILRFAVFMLGHERNVQFGDYLFHSPKNVFSVARAISVGAHGLDPTRVRVPEGATAVEIADLFAGKFQRFDRERFIKNAQPLEGYLFPDTYFFLPNANDDLVLRTLTQNFNTHLESVRPQIDEFGKPLSDIVIMASILEREAHNSTDRRMIAGVLWERLKRGMLLQVDATFAYTMNKGTSQISMADLVNEDDAYNTYVHKGLPPTPIGNPSSDSILAAVTPIYEGYLFYLADKSNVTHYSKTYEEHLANKRKYLGN